MVRPRVLHVLPETAEAGAEKQARYLVAGLRDTGRWDLQIAYFRRGSGHSQFGELGVPLLEIPQRRGLALDWRTRVRALRVAYACAEPAIVHAWLAEGSLIAALAQRAWPSARLVTTERSAAAAYRSVPYWRPLLRWVGRRADHAIANSAAGVAFLLDVGYPRERVSLIRNGLPLTSLSDAARCRRRAAGRHDLGLSHDQPVVGFVGRADKLKDLGTLFGAMRIVWKRVPTTRLVLVGPTIHQLCSLGLTPDPRVTAMGWRTAPFELMPAFDVIALSSLVEGHSNTIDEALAAGVSVVTTRAGDHPKLVERAGGRVTPTGRPDLLGQAILEMLAHPPDWRTVRTCAEQELAMGPVIDDTEQIYTHLLTVRGRATR